MKGKVLSMTGVRNVEIKEYELPKMEKGQVRV